MQYSLLSRFQGCLSGMVLGEMLGRAVEAKTGQSARTQVAWSQVVVEFLEELIAVGRWVDLSRWFELQGVARPVSSGEIAIATIPIALFFHEDLVKQRHILGQTLEHWQVSADLSDRVITIAYAIAAALKQQIDPRTFAAQILTYLRMISPTAQTASPWVTELETLNARLKSAANLPSPGLATAMDSATPCANGDAAIALYSFLSTPDTLRLAMLRATRLSPSPALAGALTGAIAGAYTSQLGIPPDWQCWLNAALDGRSSRSPKPSKIPFDQLSAHLLAIWAGIHPPASAASSALAVTAPWVIRQR